MNMDKHQINLNIPKNSAFRVIGKPIEIGDSKQSITAMAFDPEGTRLAVGEFDGHVRIYSYVSGKIQMVLNPPSKEGEDQTPIMCIRWKPNVRGDQLKETQSICALTSNGMIYHWHLQTQKLLSENDYHKEIKNNLYCGDYTADGRKLIIAGSDRNIYVYDDQKRVLEATLHSRDEKLQGHSNRIYSLKCSKEEPNLFVTAGWDGNLKIYDLQQKCPIASILGPNVSNDSLDVWGDMVIAGNNKNSQVMMLFSISQKKLIQTFEFDRSLV